MKIGDAVICIRSSNKSLTEGKEYKALHVTSHSIIVINNYGDRGSYYRSRFIAKRSIVDQEEIDIEINI